MEPDQGVIIAYNLGAVDDSVCYRNIFANEFCNCPVYKLLLLGRSVMVHSTTHCLRISLPVA